MYFATFLNTPNIQDTRRNTIAGKDQTVRLIPIAALDGREVRWIKIDSSKNAHCMTTGANAQHTAHYVCVAVKKTVS